MDTNTGGILLCGGAGTRLFPTTQYTNKHLIPIYDKPMVYYSFSILLLSGIKKITIVCNKNESEIFKKLLGDGEEFGVELIYTEQDSPKGIPDAISKALEVNNYDKFLVVLGDNFVFGEKFFTRFENIYDENVYSTIFSQRVKNPEEFGVVEVDSISNNIISIEEKPNKFISNKAVIGLYIFNNDFGKYFDEINLSRRNEYEIVDIIKKYKFENINHHEIGRGTAWFDMGTTEAFYNCSLFVRTIQERQGLLVCSPHEIAYRNEWITEEELENYIKSIAGSEYSENLSKIFND